MACNSRTQPYSNHALYLIVGVMLIMLARVGPAYSQSPGFFHISVSSSPIIRSTYARAISDDGDAIIGRSHGNLIGPDDPADFLWKRRASTVTTLLRDLDGSFWDARVEQISGDGQTIVGRYPYWNSALFIESHYAIAWSQAGGFQFLADLVEGIGDTVAYAASYDGSVIVGRARTSAGLQPVRWTVSEGATLLGVLPSGGAYGEAMDVSADGTIVVGVADSADGLQAFRWTVEAGLVGLGRLPGTIESRATAISADGQVIVGASRDAAGNERAFRWTASGGILDLGNLPGGSSTRAATAVSGDGSTIVGSARTPSTGDIGFVWTELRGMRSLPAMLAEDYGSSTGSWYAHTISDISPNGRYMAGEAVQYNDPTIIRGWGLVLPPIGDVSLNGVVDMTDLPIFVAYLMEPAESLQSRDRNLGDVNRDGQFDGRDIAGFVSLLTNP